MKVKYCNHLTCQIRYRVIDDSNSRSTIIVSGGLGGTHLIWTGLVRALRDRHNIIIWDYPGLAAGDTLPADIHMDISRLADFQKAVLDNEQIDRASLVGWSLGTQVNAQFAINHRKQIETMVAICGVAGRPFNDYDPADPLSTALGIGASLIPDAPDWLSSRLDRIEQFRFILRRIEKPTRWAKRLGLVDPLIDELVFDAIIHDFLALDVATFNRYAAAAAKHDARDFLDLFDFPMLAIAGEHDRFIRPERIKKMTLAIKDAEFFEVKGATHYMPLEYPKLLGLKIDDFIKRKTKK